MKRLSVWSYVIVFACAAVSSVHAQDFKGFYAGVNLGAAYGFSDAKTTTIFSPTGYFATTSPGAIALAGKQDLRPVRLTGGFQAGANHQQGIWVLGVEADLGSMHLSDGSHASGEYPCCAPTAFTVAQSVNTDWLFTLRPRLGLASGPVMVYGTGGLGVTNLNYQSLFTDTFATAREFGGLTQNVRGWVYGGGMEYKTSKTWSLKVEFLRAEFGIFNTTSNNLTAFSPPIAFPTNTFSNTTDLRANIIRFGANYHF